MFRNKLRQSFGTAEFTSLVWRGAKSHPSEVLITGFEPKSTSNISVLSHLKIKAPSAYVAVRSSFETALRFTPMHGFMYAMNLPEIYVNAYEIYNAPGINEPHCANIGAFENELAAACHITSENIFMAKQWSDLQPGEGFYFAEPPYMNEKYRPRSWAFEVLSQDPIEAECYEKELHKTGVLPESERVITFKEAKRAAEAFRYEFKDIIVPFDSPTTVIKSLPAHLTDEDAVVSHVIKQHAESVKSKGYLSRVNSFAMFSPKAKEAAAVELDSLSGSARLGWSRRE